MGRLRENAQASRGNADDQLEKGDRNGGKQRVTRDRALFPLHAFQHRIHLSGGHTSIVSSFGPSKPVTIQDCVLRAKSSIIGYCQLFPLKRERTSKDPS